MKSGPSSDLIAKIELCLASDEIRASYNQAAGSPEAYLFSKIT